MTFASKYLSKLQNRYSLPLFSTTADITVIIPCYNEPSILDVINSIWQCDIEGLKAEIIVVVNESELSTTDICQQNDTTIDELNLFAKENNSDKLRLQVVEARALPKKWAGVGLARKIGMDTAVSQYHQWEKPNGILVSLDADCRVEANYLQAIFSHFKKNEKCNAATIHFEHPLPEDKNLRRGIVLYELYMRYYKHALTLGGLPNSIYTIGSAFAVRADAYVKQGGMSRNKAGEDFYFLQKQVQLNFVDNINSTTVYPAARLSERVPFGTGPILQKWSNNNADLEMAYPLQSFMDLKHWLQKSSALYSMSKYELEQFIGSLSENVSRFLEDNKWVETIAELRSNCSSTDIFHKRFFHLFNAFQVLKFLNYSKEHFYEDTLLTESVIKLLRQKNIEVKSALMDEESLLTIMRKLDRC